MNYVQGEKSWENLVTLGANLNEAMRTEWKEHRKRQKGRKQKRLGRRKKRTVYKMEIKNKNKSKEKEKVLV